MRTEKQPAPWNTDWSRRGEEQRQTDRDRQEMAPASLCKSVRSRHRLQTARHRSFAFHPRLRARCLVVIALSRCWREWSTRSGYGLRAALAWTLTGLDSSSSSSQRERARERERESGGECRVRSVARANILVSRRRLGTFKTDVFPSITSHLDCTVILNRGAS